MSALKSKMLELKEQGVQRYLAKDYGECKRHFGEGIALGTNTDTTLTKEETDVLVQLLNNLSVAELDDKNPEAAVEAATKSVALDGSNVKSWYRLCRGLLANGSPFKAFVLAHARVLRHLTASNTANLDEDIAKALGVTELHPAVTVRFDEETESVGLYASANLSTGTLLFKEISYNMAGVDLETLKTEGAHSIERISYAYAMLAKLPDATRNKIIGELDGSWPRRPEDLPENVLDGVHKVLKAEKGSLNTCALLASAAMRYNYFQRGCFRVCALVNHSCIPNVAMKPVMGRSGITAVVASKEIKAGEELTNKYYADLPFLMGVGIRRHLLHSSWGFWCHCQRCMADMAASAETEHIVCPGCSGPMYLPYVPDDSDPLIRQDTGKCLRCQEVAVSWPVALKNVQEAISDNALSPDTQGPFWNSVDQLTGPKHFLRNVKNYKRVITMVPDVSIEALAREGGVYDWDESILLANTRAIALALWNGIKPFYPEAEAYRLHGFIVATTIGVMIHPPPEGDAVEGTEPVEETLRVHGKHLTQAERRLLWSPKSIVMRQGSDKVRATLKKYIK